MPFGCKMHCVEGFYTIVFNGEKYTIELIDISTKNYGYSYFEVRYNGQKIGNHQCQGNDCEKTIKEKLRKYLNRTYMNLNKSLNKSSK